MIRTGEVDVNERERSRSAASGCSPKPKKGRQYWGKRARRARSSVYSMLNARVAIHVHSTSPDVPLLATGVFGNLRFAAAAAGRKTESE